MCEYCERMDGFGPKRNRLTPELIACAQVIERELPGTPAPYEAWTIASGAAAGSIEWTHLERITKSLDAASARLSAAAHGRAVRRPSNSTKPIRRPSTLLP
jgi:hypothetical protein